MLDHTGARATFARVGVSEAHKSLGIMIAGNCQWKQEMKRLLQAAVDWRANLRAGHISTTDAWCALTHTIDRTVEYPMMATYLPKAQCKKIMRPFINSGLSASGVVRSIPRAVVWGPLRYQGLDIRHLYTTQGVEHLLAILRHGTRETQLLCTTMEELQLEIGFSNSFLSCSFEIYGPLATRSWVESTWKFLFESDIILVNPFTKPALACGNDSFLMEKYVEHGYRGAELKSLNNCRMHIQAVCLSDLCTAGGRQITDMVMDVQLNPYRSSLFSWPRSHRPSLQRRRLWQSALQKVSCRSTESQLLYHPLLPFSTTALQTWQWSYSPAEQRLFSPNGSQWDYFHVTAGQRQSVNRHYRQGGSSDTLPPDARAALVVRQRTHGCLISFGLPAASAPTRTHSQPFSTMLDSLPSASKWTIQEYALPMDLTPLLASIRDGSARAVSDGSFKDKFGTAASRLLMGVTPLSLG
jgi:hypothetical protein